MRLVDKGEGRRRGAQERAARRRAHTTTPTVIGIEAPRMCVCESERERERESSTPTVHIQHNAARKKRETKTGKKRLEGTVGGGAPWRKTRKKRTGERFWCSVVLPAFS